MSGGADTRIREFVGVGIRWTTICIILFTTDDRQSLCRCSHVHLSSHSLLTHCHPLTPSDKQWRRWETQSRTC